jgi:hypothetical protein
MDFLNLNCADIANTRTLRKPTALQDRQQWIAVAVAEATVGWSKCGPYQIATDF